MSYQYGFEAEQHVFSMLNKRGIGFTYIDKWYDVELFNKEKLGIKCCNLSIKHQINNARKKEESFRIGRFDFTNEETREKINKQNIWVCFVIKFLNNYMICGFCRGKELLNKRDIPIHRLRKIKVLSFEEWTKELNSV